MTPRRATETEKNVVISSESHVSASAELTLWLQLQIKARIIQRFLS